MIDCRLRLFLIACMMWTPFAQATIIYKHVDASGKVTYSNVYMAGSHKLGGMDEVDTRQAPRAARIEKTDFHPLFSGAELPPPPPLAENTSSNDPNEHKKRVIFLKKMLEIELAKERPQEK